MILVTLAYKEGWTDVRTDSHDVMAINFLASMGYHIFLTMVLRAPRALHYEISCDEKFTEHMPINMNGFDILKTSHSNSPICQIEHLL